MIRHDVSVSAITFVSASFRPHLGYIDERYYRLFHGGFVMAKKKKTRISLDQSDGFGSSLGAQLGLTVPVSAGSTPAIPESCPTKSEASVTYRIELRVSRRGYGGKTVTECRGIEVPDKTSKSALSRSLSKTFGVRGMAPP